MRARLLCLLAILSPAATAGQPASSLPRDLRAHVQNVRFDEVSSINGLPAGVRGELRTLFGTQTLDIFDPGRPFPRARGAEAKLPRRRLVAAGCSYEDCLLYYERDSGTTRMFRVLLLHWRPAGTKLEWGGTAPASLATIDAVRSGVLSGAITGSAGPW